MSKDEFNKNEEFFDEALDFSEELEKYLPTPDNTDKVKKPRPKWFVSFITAFATCFLTLLLYTVLIFPHIKPSATISYVKSDEGTAISDDIQGIGAIYKKIQPSIVSVSGTTDYRSFFGISSQTASGSGIIISENGYILTCYSLVGSNGEVTVKIGEDTYTAKLTGQDPKKDIAVVKIDAEGFPAITLEDSDSVNVGDNVVAAANVLGGEIGVSVTKGIICGVNNGVTLSNGNSVNLLQTDAMAGISGGCLVNEKGNVVGMLINSISSNSDKIGLAIPSSDILTVTESIINTGLTPSGLVIGIRGADAEHGVTVDAVTDNSPAKKAGIKTGDLILKADGNIVKTIAEINKIRDTHKKGDTIVLTVYRNGEVIDINVVL